MTAFDMETQAPVRHPSMRDGAKVDGRNVRRDRNRIAVIDAFLDLIIEGAVRPSVADVAERSGVSHRSVFRYFSDTDELARASVEHLVGRVSHLLDSSVDLSSSLSDRIDLVLQRRITLFGAVAPVAHLVRVLAYEQPAMQVELTSNRSLFREQIGRMFAPELAAMGAERAANTLAVIDVLCSFDSVTLLRDDQGLSADEAAGALRHALRSLLSSTL